jgi:hypothetical protein
MAHIASKSSIDLAALGVFPFDGNAGGPGRFSKTIVDGK